MAVSANGHPHVVPQLMAHGQADCTGSEVVGADVAPDLVANMIKLQCVHKATEVSPDFLSLSKLAKYGIHFLALLRCLLRGLFPAGFFVG